MKIRHRLSFKQRQIRAGYCFILPLIIGVCFFFLPAIVKTFWFSVNELTFLPGGKGYKLDFSGFGNYVNAFVKDPKFIRLAVESISKTFVNVPTVLIFSLFIASLLNQKFKGKIVARVIFFVPVILSTGIVGLIDSWDLFYYMGTDAIGSSTSIGMLNFDALLSSLDFSPTLMEIVVQAADGIYNVVQLSGMQIFIFLAAFQEIPSALYEAAMVEGCSGWELFWKITIPMVTPQIIVNAVYTLVDSYTHPGNALFSYLDELAFTQNQYPQATAMHLLYLMGLAAMLAMAGLIFTKLIAKPDAGRME